MGFTDEQLKQLQAPLDKACVAQRDTGRTDKSGNPVLLSYIEAWHAIAEANRIFGHDGWTRETVEMIENHPAYEAQNKWGKTHWHTSFRAKVRVVAHGVLREGWGYGNGMDATKHMAYELGVKEAESDAMKRALMTFGNPFGLALYDKTQANVEDAAQREYARQIEQCRQALLGASTAESFTQGRAQLLALNPPLETVHAILTEVAGVARKHGLAWDAGAKRYVPDDIPAQGGAK
jgi:DNA repair and recombination protein RAD52